MMQRRIMLQQTVLVVLATLILAVAVPGVSSQQAAPDQAGAIPVTGAKGLRSEGVRSAAQLDSGLARVAPRVAATHAKALSLTRLSLGPELRTVVGNIAPRVSATYAKALHTQALRLECGMLNDTTAPQVIAAPTVIIRGNQAVILIATNEFVSGTLRYGTRPDALSNEVQVPLFARPIEFPLGTLSSGGQGASLRPGTRYFYNYALRDICGKSTTGAGSVTIQAQLYLPLIV